MEIENHIELLLFRYMQGTVNDGEIAEVERWISASAENRKILEQICVVNFANEASLCMHKAKPYRSLAGAKRKIRKNRIRRLAACTQRVAAVLFIPLLCWTLVQPQGEPKRELKREQPQTVRISSAPGVVTTVLLPDSSKAWLNANSYIEYPTYFDGNTRDVTISGEVYFSVAKDSEKPFFINLNHPFKVKVTGTELNIEAYPSAPFISTTLVEGSIELVSANDPENTIFTLQPGEQSVWNVKGKSIQVQKVNLSAVSSWKDGKIIFRNSSIAEIASTLEKRYNARLNISPRLKDHHFTGTFTNMQLVQILEHFRISSNIRYEIKGFDLNEDGTINSTIVDLK